MKTRPLFDLNCDLGEGEPVGKTRHLLRLITSANICCGIHAGSEEITRQTIRLAREAGVYAGAHPGLPGAFGRAAEMPPPQEFGRVITSQAEAFARECEKAGTQPAHLKLHGTLYHLAEDSPPHRETFAAIAPKLCDRLGFRRFFTRAGGALLALLESLGCEVWPEAFLDRAVFSDGRLVPRDIPGAVVTDPEEALRRYQQLASSGTLPSADGAPLPIRPRTLCVHGDNPAAIEILSLIARSACICADTHGGSSQTQNPES